MPDTDRQNGPEPRRVREFANFFKRYMSISSVVAAALPIPVTAVGLIPTFSAQTSYLSTYTPMFCFLCLGFVFYTRHQLAPRMFPRFLQVTFAGKSSSSDFDRKRTALQAVVESLETALRTIARGLSRMFVPILPFLLIVAAFYCSLMYHETLSAAVRAIRGGGGLPVDEILRKTSFDQIPFSTLLALYYMGIFITAESAFILMAIKEYLQDLVGLSDFMILRGEPLPEGMSPSEALLRHGDGRAHSSGEAKLPDSNLVEPGSHVAGCKPGT